jgi:hypothetical protein
MSNPHTCQSVARWMLEQVDLQGDLYQDSAVIDIWKKFGQQFIYENEAGNVVISKPVLAAFRKLTIDIIVWERSERFWRRRDAADSPGRQQM